MAKHSHHAWSLSLLGLLFACASSPNDSEDTTDDGVESSGGKLNDGASGGAQSSSGGVSVNSGGAAPTGGATSAGGATSSGGTSANGGAENTGGIPALVGGGPSSGGGNGGSGGALDGAGGRIERPLPNVSVFIAGDSTVSEYADTASVSDQAGWGQMFAAHYDERVTVENHAIGGRTARRFIDEGRLDAIWNEISAGDFLLVQFGTNDGHQTATYEINGQTIPYYLDPATDFKTYLRFYIEGAHDRDVEIIFVTPPPRNSAYCTGGNGTGAHAQAMRDLGEEEGVGVADLNQKSVTFLTAICPAPTPEDFFLLRGDGSVDGTHFQENGARILSSMVADGVGEVGAALDAYRVTSTRD